MVHGDKLDFSFSFGDGLEFALSSWPKLVARLSRELLEGSSLKPRPPGCVPRIGWRRVGTVPSECHAGETGPAGHAWHPAGELGELAGSIEVQITPGGAGAEVRAHRLSRHMYRVVVWRLLPPILGELAAHRGWVLLHAAAVGWRDQALLLPGKGGVGKTTMYTAAANSGWPVLADDLVWIHPASGASAALAVGFPRGGWDSSVPRASTRSLPAAAMVFPEIGEPGRRDIRRLGTREAWARVWENCVNLGSPETLTARFHVVSQLVATIPAFCWTRPRIEQSMHGSPPQTPVF